MKEVIDFEVFKGNRAELISLFLLADDSQSQIQEYMDKGDITIAKIGEKIIGYVQLIDGPSAEKAEIKSISVLDSYQNKSIGKTLLKMAFESAEQKGISTIIVTTAMADISNLAFYQKMGFRAKEIVRDFFGPQNGYLEKTIVDGIEMRDQIVFEIDLVGR